MGTTENGRAIYCLERDYMGNSYISFYMHYIFSTKQCLPLIVPEIQVRLWLDMVGIARQNSLSIIPINPLKKNTSIS